MIDVFARNLKSQSDLHPADWCAEHVHVENSERGDKFDPSQTRGGGSSRWAAMRILRRGRWSA
jgi:hypothetical protein